MQKNRHRITKTIGALVLALVLVASFGAFGPKQTMAAGGTATVTLANAEGLSDGTEFEFEMYKVGHFSGPGLVLEDNLKGSGASVDFPSGSSEKEAAKAERMLASAAQLTDYIDNNGIKPDLVKAFALKPGNSEYVSVGENALYLVRSHAVRDAEASYNWEPQPVYVAVLDGDSSITISNEVAIKIVGTPIGSFHMVNKEWAPLPEGVSLSKPEAVFVNIRYGNKIVDTVKLNNDNDWMYRWTSEESGDTYKYIGTDDEGQSKTVEFKPEGDPKWSCDEVLDAQDYAENFEERAYDSAKARAFTDDELKTLEKVAMRYSSYEKPLEDTGETERHVIVNEYSKRRLELTKKLDGYVDAGDRSNVTMAFRVIAYKGDSEIYNNVIGMSFAADSEVDGDGKYTQTKVINDIPVNADKVTVEEIYSGQYAGDSIKTVEGDDMQKEVITVTMDNTHDYHQGSGVVNKYGNGDLKGREGNIEH